MQQISSKTTFFYKRVFPVLWFGFVTVFLVVGLTTAAKTDRVAIVPFLIVPLAMAAVGFVVCKTLLFDLVDEVWDAGDALIVRNRGQEERIALSDIMNVSYSPLINPPRVTLSSRRPTVFGQKISFIIPRRGLMQVMQMMSGNNPVVDDLIQRIDAARLRAR